MADALLHIKDSFYFEVPKLLWPCRYTDKSEFPEVWVRLDDEFQVWEAHRLSHEIESLPRSERFPAPSAHDLEHAWAHWQHHDPANHGKPLDVYLEEGAAKAHAGFVKAHRKSAQDAGKFNDYLAESKSEFAWFATHRGDAAWNAQWQAAKDHASDVKAFQADKGTSWSAEKLAGYNYNLSGKILVPQVFGGKLRNLYEVESGFCLSKFMILEIVAALIVGWLFIWLAGRVRTGNAPRGRLWNFLETFLLFIRDQIARPAIGGHHDDHAHGEHAHGDAAHGHTAHDEHAHSGHAKSHGAPQSVVAASANPADRFVPLLWTIFWFVLISNLLGMVPWLGAPTGSWAVTLGMAVVTFATVVFSGMRQFGFLGFFKNQVPGMSLPLPLAVLLVPMIFGIEMLGLFIKHGVLSVRLLANMVAGHLVILGIMGLAFTPEGAASSMWPITAVIAVVSAAAFNLLELFVAFLQAYIFTFLSALFIGASVHKH